jgi:Contractile injection system tube protein
MPVTPPSPRLIKGGLVLLNPDGSGQPRVVALQYNPDTITRTLQAQTAGGENHDGRSEPLRFKGPPVETIKLDAEIDATDQLARGDGTTTELGILPQLSALEALVYPTSDQLRQTNSLSGSGSLEIAPVLAPLCLFVWSERRIVPVRVTDFSITEEAFDPQLHPTRAKVSLGLRVMSVADLGFGTRAGSLYLEYQRQKEQMATRVKALGLDALGVRSLP